MFITQVHSWAILRKTHSPGWECRQDSLNCSGSKFQAYLGFIFLSVPSSSPYPISHHIPPILPPNCLPSTAPPLVIPLTTLSSQRGSPPPLSSSHSFFIPATRKLSQTAPHLLRNPQGLSIAYNIKFWLISLTFRDAYRLVLTCLSSWLICTPGFPPFSMYWYTCSSLSHPSTFQLPAFITLSFNLEFPSSSIAPFSPLLTRSPPLLTRSVHRPPLLTRSPKFLSKTYQFREGPARLKGVKQG